MSLILNIESSTTNCSVAVGDKTQVLTHAEKNDGYTHSENLALFVKDVLKRASLQPKDLSAVAVSKGPGSFTGLRIGVSLAKGLAYALKIPLIGVDTLQILALMAREQDPKADLLVPMIDARRMEVYTAVYNRELALVDPIEAMILDEAYCEAMKTRGSIAFVGNGSEKLKTMMDDGTTRYYSDLFPSAATMHNLSFSRFEKGQFEDLAYFEPYYLKEFITGPVSGK